MCPESEKSSTKRLGVHVPTMVRFSTELVVGRMASCKGRQRPFFFLIKYFRHGRWVRFSGTGTAAKARVAVEVDD